MLVLLDRDGVLNHDRPDSVKSPDELVMIDGAAQAVARLNRQGWRVAVVTNQSVVGRGIISPATLAQIHQKLTQEIARAGGAIAHIFTCTDAPDAPTHRRKPQPGMLLEALAMFCVSPEVTPMVGDALIDLEAAAAIGCPRHLVRTGKGQHTYANGLPEALQPVMLHKDLSAAADYLIKAFDARAGFAL